MYPKLKVNGGQQFSFLLSAYFSQHFTFEPHKRFIIHRGVKIERGKKNSHQLKEAITSLIEHNWARPDQIEV